MFTCHKKLSPLILSTVLSLIGSWGCTENNQETTVADVAKASTTSSTLPIESIDRVSLLQLQNDHGNPDAQYNLAYLRKRTGCIKS
jgi:hypothetical protein